MDSSIGVALISSGAGIIIALIGAWASSGKAVAAAVAPLRAQISKLREQVITLGGDPDEEG